MSSQEQTLLCTLLPFAKYTDSICSHDVALTESTAIQIVWRTNEVRVTSPDKTYIYSMDQFEETSWMHLVGTQFCKLNVIYRGEEAIGIRVYLLNSAIEACYKETELCSTQFMAFEFSLTACLRQGYYFVENSRSFFASKKKSSGPDFSPKLLHVNTLFTITDNVQWCFNEFCFKSGAKGNLDSRSWPMDPIILAANSTNHWRQALLDQTKHLAAENNMLIISNDVSKWPSNFIQVSEFGHPQEAKGIFIANSDTVFKNFQLQMDLLDMVKIISQNIFISRSESQTRRILVSNLAKKLPLFNLPVHFHTYSAVILDNFTDLSHIDLLPASMTNRWIKVVHENENTKPAQLTFAQLKRCLTLDSKILLPLLWAQTSLHLIAYKVPKQILRRYRLIGHPIRDGLVEERIARIFPNGCPLQIDDAIQRFSGAPVPGKLAAEFLTRHFQRLASSVGEYSLPMTNAGISTVNKEFVNMSLNCAEKECCICNESLTDDFHFTVCGHIYCSECSKTYFQGDWSQNKTKECAICRANLVVADVFKIKVFTKDSPFVSVLGSKAQSIQAFTKCMRNKNVIKWSELLVPQPLAPSGAMMPLNEEPIVDPTPITKNIIVDNVHTCTVSSILRKTGPLNIHVFYTKDESLAFFNLQKNFL